MRKSIDATSYDSDKSGNISLVQSYEECFQHLVDKEIKLLELGVWKGGSLLLWRDYFENGIIVGLDRMAVHIDDPTGRIRVYQGNQQDTALLDRIAKEQAPEGFDIIIDDCSHIALYTRISFWHLFENHLKPGGIYVIEDWGTGYLDSYPDGRPYRCRSHGAYSWPRSYGDRLLIGIVQRIELLRTKLTYYSKLRIIAPALLLSLPKLIKLCFMMTRSAKTGGHTYGMVGFVKELIDACHWEQVLQVCGRYHTYKIHKMHFFWNHVVIFKSDEHDCLPFEADAG